MANSFSAGDCVRIPDGRIGRVREQAGTRYRVRVRRKTSKTHQFLEFEASALHKVDCPKGWMSPAGYVRYLKVTLAKMRERLAKKRSRQENK
jgi:hypothetical protein